MNFIDEATSHHPADRGQTVGLLVRIAVVALVGLCLIGLAVNAQAQENSAAPPEAGQLISSGWLKQVSAVPNNPDQTFNMISYQSRNAEGRVLVEVGIIEVPEQPKRMIMVLSHIDEGHLIPAGIGIRVDDNEPRAGQFVFCNPVRCQGEIEIDDALIAEMKAGNNLFVLSRKASNGEAVGVAMSLEGFTASYDGPGVDSAQMAAQEEQYNEQFNEALKRRAEQNRQRLQQQDENQ